MFLRLPWFSKQVRCCAIEICFDDLRFIRNVRTLSQVHAEQFVDIEPNRRNDDNVAEHNTRGSFVRIADEEEETGEHIAPGHDRNEVGTFLRRKVDGREQRGADHHQAMFDVVGEHILRLEHLALPLHRIGWIHGRCAQPITDHQVDAEHNRQQHERQVTGGKDDTVGGCVQGCVGGDVEIAEMSERDEDDN